MRKRCGWVRARSLDVLRGGITRFRDGWAPTYSGRRRRAGHVLESARDVTRVPRPGARKIA
jgi:hypothetical protein